MGTTRDAGASHPGARRATTWRRGDAQMLFDLDLALDHSEKNPVYKVQYAHARMSSIFRKAGLAGGSEVDAGADLSGLTDPTEEELIKVLLRLPEVVATAAERHAPHSVCEYLEEVAGAVNSWYHAGNLNPELRVVGVDEGLSRARLVLARAIQLVLANGLAVLGVAAPERLDRDADAA